MHGQLTGSAASLDPLSPNLGWRVLRRRFQIAGMLTLLVAWIGFIMPAAASPGSCYLPSPSLSLLASGADRGIQAFGRQRLKNRQKYYIMTAGSPHSLPIKVAWWEPVHLLTFSSHSVLLPPL